MLIVKIEANKGFHALEFQNGRTKCWLDGFVKVPKNLERVVIDSNGYCDLIIENGVLTNVVPRPDYAPEKPQEDFKVSPIEQLRADVDFLALMSGVNL